MKFEKERVLKELVLSDETRILGAHLVAGHRVQMGLRLAPRTTRKNGPPAMSKTPKYKCKNPKIIRFSSTAQHL